VLLATDGSETSAEAARAVAERLWPEGSEFRVISVEELWAIKPSRVKEDKEAQDSVSNAKELLASAGLKPIGAVLSGNTRGAILSDAKQWGADLIFVGSHGRRGIKRFLLGSVSEGVAMDAHCSVVVVRGRRKTET
jgi:nucleotide-binding universal stress UspA family protein